MNGFNSGKAVRSTSFVWQIRFHIFIRTELVIGGPIKFMKNTLATIGIISELSRGVLMLFNAQILRQHWLVDTYIVETAFVNGFKPSGFFVCPFFTYETHKLRIFRLKTFYGFLPFSSPYWISISSGQFPKRNIWMLSHRSVKAVHCVFSISYGFYPSNYWSAGTQRFMR